MEAPDGATFNLHADQPWCGDLHYEIGRGLGIGGPQGCCSRPTGGQPERVATGAPRSDLLCCSPPRFAFDLVPGTEQTGSQAGCIPRLRNAEQRLRNAEQSPPVRNDRTY